MEEQGKPSPVVLNTMQVDPLVHLNRAHALVYSCALLALFYHRTLSLLTSPTFLSFSLFLSLTVAELVLAFMWVLSQAFRWRPVRRREFPERLASAVDKRDWPALDVFICTADPYREPPMTVVNTALSVMAFDYPTNKLSLYISDDGGSQLTLFAFMEAARFARYWLPFCREHGLVDRSPEAYFSSCDVLGGQSENMKILYQGLKEKVESAMGKGSVDEDLLISNEELRLFFKEWTVGFTRQEHPTVIKVLVESSREVDIANHPLPNLIYVSREKKKDCQHHFKAGALNVLIRVSGVMTNAPVVLTLDCDMHSNDPQTPQRALCHLLDHDKLSYVQFPQRFKGIDEHDIYAGEVKRAHKIYPSGMDGFQGPNYNGSGSFFSRSCFYASPSNWLPPATKIAGATNESISINSGSSIISSEAVITNAHQVSSCSYEHGTKLWGYTMGMRYGSLVEDFNTGYHLHCEGWESVFCDPQRPAFLGELPINFNDVLSHCKRCCVGLLEVASSKYGPLNHGSNKCSLPMAMCYSQLACWGIWCIPISIYAILPSVTLAHQVSLFPKAFGPWWYLYIYLFSAAYAQDLTEFLRARGTARQWWNDQRMWMVLAATSSLFGFTQFLLQHVCVPTLGFNVTNKVMDDERRKLYDNGVFDFGVDSPFFVSLGTVAILNLASFTVGLLKSLRRGNMEDLFMQILISGFVMVNCWPIYEAMVWRRDGGRMPARVTRTSLMLAGAIYSVAYFIF